MQVFLNDKSIVIFEGARVRDLVLSYSMQLWKEIAHDKTQIIVDRRGNVVSLDGALIENQKFYTRNGSYDED